MAIMITPTITPNSPMALAKISIIRIRTKSCGRCASAIAQELPTAPTEIPQERFDRPTMRPTANMAQPL